jgi:prepilin-type N-terminal cleavage/methylation domain-containing protein
MCSKIHKRFRKALTPGFTCGQGCSTGFTLLEMLIASFLIGVIVTALWSLSSVYTRLFEAGLHRVETVQVVRALVEQLRKDLLHAVQDPIGGISTTERRSVPVRRFGLFGTETELRLDVLQPLPEGGQGEPEYGDRHTATAGSRKARLPELRTVYYRFHAFQSSLGSSQDSDQPVGGPLESSQKLPILPGLIRWEEDFETPLSQKTESSTSVSGLGLGGMGKEERRQQEGFPASFSSQLSLPELYQELEKTFGEQVLYLPEVVDFRLRYFDGQSWSSRWDSLARRALPVAIEVVFRVELEAEGPEDRLAGEGGTGTSPQSVGSETGQMAESRRPGQIYRIVVEIPGSPRFQGARRVTPVTERPRMPPVPVRPAVPPRPPLPRPVEPPRPLAPADQWMRVSE